MVIDYIVFILKRHIKDCNKIYDKQTIKVPKQGEYLKFQNFETEIKSPFIIQADFESILMPEDNGNKNKNESYSSKYQKHVACSYDYKIVCVENEFNKHFTSYLGEDAVCNFISSIIEERKYCGDVIKNILTKNL